MKTSNDTSAIYRMAIAACFLTGCFFTLKALQPLISSAMPQAAAEVSADHSLETKGEFDSAATSSSSSQLTTTSIEDIQLGQRVVGTNPLREQTQPASSIDPHTWRAVRLQMHEGGIQYDLAFLRPLSWISSTGAVVGSSIHLELHEMGLDGPAEVVAIDPCPEIEADDGTGRNVVTGTMAHPGPNVLYLDITGLEEPLGVTDNHPLWSETRQEFVSAGKLRIGERFRSFTGDPATLSNITLHRGPPEMVFNLEVDAEHVYSVACNGLLVHNSYERKIGKELIEEPSVTKALDNMGTGQRRQVDKLLDDIAHNRPGRNLHALRGDRAGQMAADVPGTGRGRGALRLIFKETDTGIILKEIVDYH